MLEPLVATAGYLFGAALHATLLRLISRRPLAARSLGEGLFAALAAALLVFHAAKLAGALAALVTQAAHPGLDRALDLVAVPALAVVPSLLLHALGLLGRGREARGGHPARLLAYAPILPLAITLGFAPEAFPATLGAWLVISLLAGVGIALRLARGAAARPDALPATPGLYRFLALTLLGTAALAALVAFVVGPRGGFLADVLVMAGTTLPSFALAYGVYRYYAIRPLVRRGGVELLLGTIALGVYLLGISTGARALAAGYGWSVRALEGIGVVALLAVFFPFRRRVLRALAFAFDPRGEKETAVLRSLAQDLARPGASRPAELCARAAEGIREALALERAGLAIAGPPGAPVYASPPDWIDWPALLAAVADAPAGLLFPEAIGALDPPLARALAAARVERVRPLRYEGALAGALVLGRRADSTSLAGDELGAVEGIAGALAAACTGVRLNEQSIALELRLADAQRLAGLGRLSATVAHRVKNPLASIKAIVQALREDLAADDARRQDLGIVVEEVDALTRVVSQLLGFARGAPGGEPGPVDLGRIAADVVLLMQHQAAAAHVAIRIEAPERPLPPVSAEPSALREALANLVENAISFSPAGAEVTVALEPARDGRAVRVRVADRGPGVAPDARARLFEPFFTTRPGGTGLGLAVSRQRIEAWGGRIYLEEGANGGGARFAFELPAAEGAAEPRACESIGSRVHREGIAAEGKEEEVLQLGKVAGPPTTPASAVRPSEAPREIDSQALGSKPEGGPVGPANDPGRR